MNYFSNIVAKISAFCTIFIVSTLIFASPVYASDPSGIHEITLNIQQDTHLLVDHKVNLKNGNKKFINGYELRVPFSDIQDVQVTKNNKQVKHKLKNGNRIIIQLKNPVKFNKLLKLNFTYQVKDQVTNENGLISFYMPRINISEKIKKFNFTLNYPPNFPQISYLPYRDVEHDKQKNQLLFKTNQGIKVVWGSQWGVVITDSADDVVPTSDGKLQLVNLVPDISGQQVRYRNMSVNNVFAEANGNVWGHVDDEFSYSAFVSKVPGTATYGKFTGYIYTEFVAPKVEDKLEPEERFLELEVDPINEEDILPPTQLDSQASNTLAQVYAAYNYLTHNFSLTQSNLESLDQLEKISSKLGDLENSEFTSLELAYIFAGYLEHLKVPHRLDYGYFYGVSWPKFNEQLPHVWIEAEVDGQTKLFDPFMEALTGLNFFDVPDVGRIKFGIWNPNNSADTLLGMAGTGIKLRPIATSTSEVLGLETNQFETTPISISVVAPRSVNTLEPYTVNLRMQNASNKIIRLENLLWDDQDLTEKYLHVNDSLQRALAPLGSLQLEIDNLYWPEVFFDGDVVHQFTIIPDNSDFDASTTSYSIAYAVNVQVLIAVFVAIVLSMALIVSLWRRWERRQKLIQVLENSA